jgi:hypothetical protein
MDSLAALFMITRHGVHTTCFRFLYVVFIVVGSTFFFLGCTLGFYKFHLTRNVSARMNSGTFSLAREFAWLGLFFFIMMLST